MGPYLSNNSAWDWEIGLQSEGLLYRNDMGCCVVMGGAAFYLTTRHGIGRVDFRGEGCCIAMMWVAVLGWVGQFFI